eukprot:1142685-Pelagomonas_calceolata.AAC.1
MNIPVFTYTHVLSNALARACLYTLLQALAPMHECMDAFRLTYTNPLCTQPSYFASLLRYAPLASCTLQKPRMNWRDSRPGMQPSVQPTVWPCSFLLHPGRL